MAQNQFLHELLKEDQEPFRLKNYIADRRCRLKKPSPPASLHLGKRKPNHIHEASASRRSILCKHACFLSFQNSPDVMKSPFFDFQSPAKSPCKSPNGAVLLHIPTKTASLLVEAAMRIQKQQQPKPKAQGAKGVGLGLLGSFMKRLKDRSKSKTRAIETLHEPPTADKETVRMSCSCSNRRPSSANWTENNELDFEASTSSSGSEFFEEIIRSDFEFSETRFCTSPFRFNLQKSPPPSGGTPEFCSPASSPIRCVNQENENYQTSSSANVQGEGEEEKEEQCSPVSVFDPPFEDDGRLNGDVDENDDYDLECSYANVQRVKQQLLYRLRRFEKLAELDTIELERGSVEGSDDEDHMSVDMKKLVSDLIIEEKSEKVNSCDNEVVMSRICNKLDSWREVEPNTIDMMVGFDLKGEFDGWTRFNEQVEEVSAEIEVAILGLLVKELSQELVKIV